MFAFVFAMEKEAAPVLKEATIIKEEKVGYTRLVEATYQGVRFLVGISGIGKGFAASAMTVICTHPVYSKELEGVINVGVAGSFDKSKADILSCVIASECIEHDMDTSGIGDEPGMVSGINVIRFPGDKKLSQRFESVLDELEVPHCYGLISSGDVFMTNDEDKKTVREKFGSLSVDMESAPFAQIAYVFNVPFLSARFISDVEDPEREYALYAVKAAEKGGEAVLRFIAKNA